MRGDDRIGFPKGMMVTVVAAFVLAALCSGFFLQAVRIQGASMEPTLRHNDWVLSRPRAYADAMPERGDVVLLQRSSLTRGYIVKRVMGIPGDTVEIRRGTVFVNGAEAEDPYGAFSEADNMSAVIVQPDTVFVLGDNRPASNDSRVWEPQLVGREELRGEVICRLFPQWKEIR